MLKAKILLVIILSLLLSGCGVTNDINEIKTNSEIQMTAVLQVTYTQGLYEGSYAIALRMLLGDGWPLDYARVEAARIAEDLCAAAPLLAD